MIDLRLLQRVAPVVILVGLALGVGGCETCKPGKPISAKAYKAYPVTVNLAPSLKHSSVEVDLVGVNPAGLPRLANYSMTKYWEQGDPMRLEADKVTISFLDGNTLTHTMGKTHAIWTNWQNKGVTHVVVLSLLPGTFQDKPGNQDVRRQILSLNECKWVKGTTNLTVAIQQSGIEILTPIRPGWETE